MGWLLCYWPCPIKLLGKITAKSKLHMTVTCLHDVRSKVLPYFTRAQGNFLANKSISLNNSYLEVKLNNLLDFNKHRTHLYNSAVNMSYTLYKKEFYSYKNCSYDFRFFYIIAIRIWGSILYWF